MKRKQIKRQSPAKPEVPQMCTEKRRGDLKENNGIIKIGKTFKIIKCNH